MRIPDVVVMRPEVPGTGDLMAPALLRISWLCEKDPLSETTGEELSEHLLESFALPLENARYLMILGVVDGVIVGNSIGRIDVGYENRRHCTLGFFALDRGFNWKPAIIQGMSVFEDWAKTLGCSELRLSTFSQAHARLYRFAKYGGFEPLFVTMSRRI